MPSVAEQAVSALDALLQHGGMSRKGVDERFVEVLLATALDREPALAHALGLPSGAFRLGGRGHEPDVVGESGPGTPTCGIEVKLHSNINWGSYGGGRERSQLDRYAEVLGAVPLILLTTDGRQTKLLGELGQTGPYAVRSRRRWTVVPLSVLERGVTGVMQLRGYAPSPSAQLFCTLGRLV